MRRRRRSGITNEFGHLFVAHLASIGRPDQHEAVARIELVDQQSFRSMIAAGDISDGPTLAAYAQAQARGLLA